MTRKDLLGRIGIVVPALLGTALGGWGLWLGLVQAPLDAKLGITQRIFYLHAPIGLWTIALLVMAALFGGIYLRWRLPMADQVGEAAMELSVPMSAIVLVTGSIWAKADWGTWFPWSEPRVASFTMVFLIGLAYLVLRSSVDEPDQRARFSAVTAIVGGAVALLSFYAIRIWNTHHPHVITAKEIKMDPAMVEAFLICIAAVFFIFWSLLAARYRLGALKDRLDRLEQGIRDSQEFPA